jgi:hypothetical protein
MFAYTATPTPTYDTWGSNSYYGATATAMYGAPQTTVVYYNTVAVTPEPPLQLLVRKSKAERAREQMRAYLARFPRQGVSATVPVLRLAIASDPLRHHRSRCMRRAPRLSWLRRAA